MSTPLGDLASTASSATATTRSSKRSKQKKWDPIALPLEAEVLEQTPPEILCKLHLPRGSLIRFFPHDMRHMYTAPSQSILLTRGVLDYVREYNQVGPAKSKGKLFLCSMYEKTDSCDNSFVCREVHCTLKAATARMRAPVTHPHASVTAAAAAAAGVLESPSEGDDRRVSHEHSGVHASPASPSGPTSLGATSSSGVVEHSEDFSDTDPVLTYTDVHMSSAPETAHPCHEPGVLFRLALPNMQAPVDEIPSEKIFVTKGSKLYFDQVSNGETPTMNMQHCAHFLKNGLCCFGAECQFVHVVLQARRELLHEHSSHNDSGSERGDFGSSSVRSRSSSMGSSLSSDASSGHGKKNRASKRAKETPLSMTDAVDGPFGGRQANPPQVLYAPNIPLQHQHHQQATTTASSSSLPMGNMFPSATSFGAPQGYFQPAGGVPTALSGMASPQYHTQFIPMMTATAPAAGGASQPMGTTGGAYMTLPYANAALSMPQQGAPLNFMPAAGSLGGGNPQPTQLMFAPPPQGGMTNWFSVANSAQPQTQPQPQQPVYIIIPHGAMQSSGPTPTAGTAAPQPLYFVPQQPQTTMQQLQPQQQMQTQPMNTAFMGGAPLPPQNTVSPQPLTQQQLFMLQHQMQLQQQQHR